MKNSKNVGNPNASSSYSYGNINDSAKNKTYLKRTMGSLNDEEYNETRENYEITSASKPPYSIVNTNGTKVENLQVTEEPAENEEDNVMMEYIEKLEKKVREQASRLSEFEKYRYICEKMVKKLNPSQTFPIQEQHIAALGSNVPSNNNESKNTISIDKYELLQKKIAKLMTDYNELKSTISSNNKEIARHTFEFPEVDKIQNLEKLKEMYSSLLVSFKEQIMEKEEVLQMLRQETINSEEQRNYIEVLKQTLESELIKSGVLVKYITIDNLLDFNLVKMDSDKHRKELVLSQALISSLKSENDELKSNNNVLIKNKEKVKVTLEESLGEMEKCQQKVKLLEATQDDLEAEIKALKDTNTALIKERDELATKNSNLTGKVKEISKLSENQNEMIANRLNDYKLNFEKINKEFEDLLKEKNNLEVENAKLNSELKNLVEKSQAVVCNCKSEENKNAAVEISPPLDINAIHPNYRKLYEEISLEFEEYKNAQKKMSKKFLTKLKKSYDKSHDELIKEHMTVANENNQLKVNIEKLEAEINKHKDELTQFQADYNKTLSLYEEELKQSKALQIEKNNLTFELEKLNKENNFLKEKYEKDLALKTNELDSLYEQISNFKSENIKLNDSVRENKKNRNEDTQVIEDLQFKVDKYEKALATQNEKESEMQKKTEQLNKLSSKYQDLLNMFEDCSKEMEYSKKLIDELKKEKYELENNLQNLEEMYEGLKKDNTKSSKELNSYKNENSDLEKQIENLKKKINDLESETNEKEQKMNNFIMDLNKLEQEIEYLANEREQLKKENTGMFEKNKVLQDIISELRILLYSMHSQLKLSIHKFNSYANEDLDSLLTKNFSQSVTKLVLQVNNYTTDVEDNFILHLAFDFLKILSEEFENVYEKLLDSSSYIKEANGKVVLLENSLNEISKSQGQMLEKEKKLKQIINKCMEEKTQMDKKIKENKNDLDQEINFLKSEREKLFEEAKKLKNEIYSLINRNEKLMSENQNLHEEINKHGYDNSKLENKCIMINREKKMVEGLLLSFVRSYPSKEIAKYMSDILNINDFISRTENEKVKVEEKLISLEKEYKMLTEDKSSQNNDLSMIVLNQQESLRKLIQDYDKKIYDKRDLQKHLENEVYNLESSVKNIFEQIAKLENENKLLIKELEEYKSFIENQKNYSGTGGISKYNTNSTNPNPFLQGLRTNKGQSSYVNNLQLPNNNIDISCLESNIFSVNNTKSNQNKNMSEHQLTDYESIELEYSEDNFKEKYSNYYNNLQISSNKSLVNGTISGTNSQYNTINAASQKNSNKNVTNTNSNNVRNTVTMLNNNNSNRNQDITFNFNEKEKNRKENIDKLGGITNLNIRQDSQGNMTERVSEKEKNSSTNLNAVNTNSSNTNPTARRNVNLK